MRSQSWFRYLTIAVLLALVASLFGSEVTRGAAQSTFADAVTFIPGTVAVSGDTQSLLQQAILEAQASLPAGTLPVVQYWAVTHIADLGEYQLVSVAGLDGIKDDLAWTLEDNLAWPGLVLLRADQAAMRGTAAFSQLLAGIPESVLSAQSRRGLDPAQSRLSLTQEYRFPWTDNTNMQYGIYGVHNAGFAGIVGSGWKAVDMFTDGDTSAGHAPNSLLAAEAGSIRYVCKDSTSVAIVINDLVYIHLQNNANLVTGHSFALGEAMGELRMGSFSGNCGTASQPDDWVHVHWGFPPADGAFTAGGWTLSFSDGLWRRASETRGTSAWFTAEPITPTLTVLVEDLELTPAAGEICETYWYPFDNNRGHTAYLTLNTNDIAQSTNSAIWRPDLPQAGFYQVEAYIASHSTIDWPCPVQQVGSDTSDAHYTIYHALGSTELEKDQQPLDNAWLPLDEYWFEAGTTGYVSLVDLNHETNFSHTVSFSAMRFRLVTHAPSQLCLSLLVQLVPAR